MSQEFWLVIAGLVTPLVIQSIKLAHVAMFGGELASKAALAWTFAVAVGFAVAIHLTVGGFAVPAGGPEIVAPWVVAQIGIVMGIATTVYKFVLSEKTRIV